MFKWFWTIFSLGAPEISSFLILSASFSSSSYCFSSGITFEIAAFWLEALCLCCCVHSQKRKLAVFFPPSVTKLSTMLWSRAVMYPERGTLLKVARYSFSRSIPPKFERKLRRHKQGLGKIDTSVVLDKDENWLWSRLQWHRSCHSNEMTLLPIFLAAVFRGTGNCSSKSFTGAFTYDSCLDVREV